VGAKNKLWVFVPFLVLFAISSLITAFGPSDFWTHWGCRGGC
jgi:hypothetical protein